MVVYKYTFHGGISNVFDMPKGAEVLTVQEQHGNICMWARVDPKRETERRLFRIVGTGDDRADGEYVGTVQMCGGDFVFHIFEGKPA